MDEVKKLEKKLSFSFKNTNKFVFITEEDKEDYRINKICRFCEKELIIDEVSDHCHLTGKNRGPARSKCKIKITQKQGKFLQFIFHNVSIYDCHLFSKKLVGLTRRMIS